MRWLRYYSGSTRRTMKAVMRSVPVSLSRAFIFDTRLQRLRISYEGSLG